MYRKVTKLLIVFIFLLLKCGGDKDKICKRGDSICIPEDPHLIISCNEEGTGWNLKECNEGELCYNNKCEAINCYPGSKICEGNNLMVCNTQGKGYELIERCEIENKVCKDGECISRICTPGEKRCSDNNYIEICNDDGIGWKKIGECKSDEVCLYGICVLEQCKEGESICINEKERIICNRENDWILESCTDQKICFLDQCIECITNEQCGLGKECEQGECKIQAPIIITEELPIAILNQYYETRIEVEGGVNPYHWYITQGELPQSLSLNSEDGTISGTPQQTGQWNFNIVVEDSNHQIANKDFSIMVYEEGPIRIVTQNLPNGMHGIEYQFELRANGGLRPYAWQLLQGVLPQGLFLTSDGIIRGTPEEIGNFTFSIRVIDASTPPQYDTKQFTLKVEIAPLEIIGDTEYNLLVTKVIVLPMIIPYIPYYTQLQARGGLKPYHWSEEEPPLSIRWMIPRWGLPEGLTLNNQGVISGLITDTNDAVTINIPFGPQITGYFIYIRVIDSQNPPASREAIFCIPTVPLN